MLGNSTLVNTYRIASNTATWYPTPIAVSGTLTSTGVRIIGTGTDFLTEKINAGDYLVDSTNIARMVVNVVSATELEIASAFVTPLSGATVTRIKDKVLKYLKVAFTDNDGSMKGANQDTVAVWPLEFPWESPNTSDYIQPQLVTPGAGGASIITGQ